MMLQAVVPVVESSQIGEVRRTVLKMCAHVPLGEARSNDAAIIATELATNLVRHARGGRVFVQVPPFGGSSCLELIAIDTGPGVENLSKCLQDGFSTGGTAGTGFGAVRRLSNEFDAYSTIGKGTVVVSRLWPEGTTSEPPFVVGAVATPAPGETVCGDAWSVLQQDGSLAVIVADGLGHGPLARDAADRAIASFESHGLGASDAFYEKAHGNLTGSRGAAVARAVIGPSGRCAFAGVGNIAGSLVGPEGSKGLASANGTVGVVMSRRGAELEYVFPSRGLLILHSDGITGRWSFDNYPGLRLRHPAVVAAVLLRDFLRGRDDATIVVIGRSGDRT